MRGIEIHRTEAPIYALASARGMLFAGCGDGTVLAWSTGSPDRIRRFAKVPASIFSLAACHERTLAIGTQAGELILIDIAERKPVAECDVRQGAIHAIEALPGERFASAGADGTLLIWGAGPGPVPLKERHIPLLDGKLRALRTSSDGGLLAAAGADGTIRLLETAMFNECGTWSGHEGGTTALAFHPTKPVLLSGGKDGHIRAWDLRESGKELMSIAAHRGTIYSLLFDPDGRALTSASRDKTVKRWNADDLASIARYDAREGGHAHSVNALCVLDGELFSAGDDRRLVRWSSAQSG